VGKAPLGRVTPDLPCGAVFGDDLWKGVIVFRTQKRPPADPPPLRAMIRISNSHFGQACPHRR
jgi:hypothetical protein